ncbi:MAG TPA: DAK2 domain-containing protein [Thermomicrobiales bacterium]|nr:DAK2 domain-containing protein [Thermomicrobiales bacterium]
MSERASAPPSACDGAGLLAACEAAGALLARHAEAINALNVFPVPDGDTGKNMLLTMRAALEAARAAYAAGETGAGAVAARVARGALLGSRGNSGVILSQILRGLARGLGAADTFDGARLAAALREAAATAYRAVQQPVEGTMLTVIREAAEAAEAAVGRERDLPPAAVLDRALTAARSALARTPDLLPRLREAGVIDAGGQGVVTLLEGAAAWAHGEPLPEAAATTAPAAPGDRLAAFLADHEDDEFGYCTNLMLLARPGDRLDFPLVRGRLLALGASGVVSGDEELVKVHIHTEHPGAVLEEALRWGELSEIRIDNMNAQVRGVAAGQPVAMAALPAADGASGPRVVAVASGAGLTAVLRGLGATAIVAGGQTMNPSTEELLRAVEALPGDEVLLLPNNPNVLLSARQVAGLTAKRVVVVPTRSVPQGIAALAAANFDAGLDDNAAAMTAALAAVRSGEVTRAVRDATIDGVSVTAGEVIGLLDGVLCCSGPTLPAVLLDLLDRMDAPAAELITLYRGAATGEEDAARVLELLAARYPAAAIELVDGGQPHYEFLVSVE